MKLFLLLLSALCSMQLNAQVAISNPASNPDASAMLDVKSNNKGFLMPRVSNRTNVASPATGLLVYETATNALWVYNGSAWVQLGSGGGSSQWATSPFNVNHIYNINTGSVGVGTNNPFAKLHVSGGSLYMQDNRNGAVLNPFIMFDIPGVDYKEGGLQWRRNSDTLASIKYVANPNTANYIRFSANDAGTGPFTYVSGAGLGVGIAEPVVPLHLRKFDLDEIVRLEAANPTISFRRYAGILNYDDVGFVQTDGLNLRIGTYSSNNNGKFVIRTNGNDNVVVSAGGFMGIGNTNPWTRLHIEGGQDAGLDNTSNGFLMLGPTAGGNIVIDGNEIIARSGFTTPSTLFLQNNGGALNVGATTTINAATNINGVATINGATNINVGTGALGIDGSTPTVNFYDNGVFKSFITQNATEFYLGVNGRLRLDATSSVAIGAVDTDGDGYKLAVNGRVVCEELKVKLSQDWPDYVFANDYKLLPLTDLKNFIKENKHLPNIPSAAVVEKEGIQVGDMQKRLMEKVEELTLYILQLEEKLNRMEARMKNNSNNNEN